MVLHFPQLLYCKRGSGNCRKWKNWGRRKNYGESCSNLKDTVLQQLSLLNISGARKRFHQAPNRWFCLLLAHIVNFLCLSGQIHRPSTRIHGGKCPHQILPNPRLLIRQACFVLHHHSSLKVLTLILILLSVCDNGMHLFILSFLPFFFGAIFWRINLVSLVGDHQVCQLRLICIYGVLTERRSIIMNNSLPSYKIIIVCRSPTYEVQKPCSKLLIYAAVQDLRPLSFSAYGLLTKLC